MKKIVSIILVMMLVLFSVPAFADTDFSEMSDEELEQLIQMAQAELDRRKALEEETSLKNEGMVSVREAGFQIINRGKWLYYSFIAHSNLTEKAIQYPEFKIVVRDADGALISSDSQVLSILYPGQEIMFSNMGMNVEGEKPANIEIEFVEPGADRSFVDPNTAVYPNYIPVEVTSSRVKQNGNVVGEFVNTNPYDIDQVAVSVLFRNADGKLMAGDTTYLHGAKAGKITTFEINVSSELITDDFEIFIQPW